MLHSKKDAPQSPTQYYLSELGLNLEWQNNLLQFGPADQNGQDYINNLRSQESYDRNSIRIRTYPHICIPATKDALLDPPPLDLALAIDARIQSEGDMMKGESRECESNCWASSAMSVVLESLQQALPAGASAPKGPQVINRVIDILRAYPEALERIEELQKELDDLGNAEAPLSN